MTKNVSIRRPKLLDLDQLLIWENNLDNSVYSDNPIFYTKEQIEQFLTSDQDIFLDRQIRFMIDSSGFPVGCVDLFKYDMVNSRSGVGIFIDEKFRNMGIATKALSLLKSICIKDYFISNLHVNILHTNKASIQLFERAGFIKNGVKENWIRTENSMLDVWFFQCFL
ncbi:GNAT family protein [Flavobacteriales bacterium]|nr:GNAT family protein [Flavobacteriales bacterium]